MLCPCCQSESRYVRGEDADGEQNCARSAQMEIPFPNVPAYIRRRECLNENCRRRFNTVEIVFHIDPPTADRGQLFLFATN